MEGDAGSGRLTPTESDVSASDEPDAPAERDRSGQSGDESPGKPSRLGRGWLAGITAVLLVVALATGVGGYLAQRAHRASVAAADADTAAVAAAKDCLLALHAPDPAAMDANQRKILECATGSFVAQAPLWVSVLAEAYAAADIHVQMQAMQAAVERHNDDGSIDVLAAFRVHVSSTNQDVGYRLRVNMARDEGEYKVANIEQVAQ